SLLVSLTRAHHVLHSFPTRRSSDLEEGTSVAEANTEYRTRNRYYNGVRSHFDAKYAIDTERFWDFLESTQEEELSKLKRSNDWKDRKSTRLNSSHVKISYAVFCLKK